MLFLLLGLGLFGVGVAAWTPLPAGVWHDDGVYMLVGKSLAAGNGMSYEGVVGAPPAAKFPPLYPALLGSLWLLLPGIGAVTMAATLLNLALLATGGALLARALHTSGLPPHLGLLAAGLGFVSTDLLRTALLPLSESLFVALAMAALALWPAALTDRGERARVGIALLLLLAVVTRSAGLAVVFGFGVAFVLARGLRVAAAITAPALVASALWARWASVANREIPEGMRDLLGSYGSWLLGQAASAPGAFAADLPSHALGVLRRAASIALPGLAGWPLLAASVPLAALAALGLVRLARRLPPLPWIAGAYVAMLLLWPYLDRRLVAPLHPLLMAAVAVGAHTLIGSLRNVRVRAATSALAAVWVSAYAIVTAARIAEGWPTAPYRLRAEQLASAVEALENTAPPDAIVGAPEFWAALHLHGGWTVAPSARFEPRSTDPERPMWGTPAEQIALWRTTGVDHLLLEQGGTLHGAALDRLEAACPGTVFVLARMPPLMVVRLVGVASCDVE